MPVCRAFFSLSRFMLAIYILLHGGQNSDQRYGVARNGWAGGGISNVLSLLAFVWLVCASEGGPKSGVCISCLKMPCPGSSEAMAGVEGVGEQTTDDTAAAGGERVECMHTYFFYMNGIYLRSSRRTPPITPVRLYSQVQSSPPQSNTHPAAMHCPEPSEPPKGTEGYQMGRWCRHRFDGSSTSRRDPWKPPTCLPTYLPRYVPRYKAEPAHASANANTNAE